jgi:hypothetical protein
MVLVFYRDYFLKQWEKPNVSIGGNLQETLLETDTPAKMKTFIRRAFLMPFFL